MHADVILVGGGLSAGLLALKLSQSHPTKRILLLEKGPSVGGNHTWCFFESDVANVNGSNAKATTASGGDSMEWMKPLVSRSWESVEVQFPNLKRTLPGRYHAIQSSHYHRVLSEKLGSNLRLNCEVRELSESSVTLVNGTVLYAPLIVDARGADTGVKINAAGSARGFQKFVGFDVKLKAAHGLTQPILMNAQVPQMEGFRYFYCLPWSETNLLIEECFYSASPELNHERLKLSLLSQVERMGLQFESIERKEQGVIPLPLYTPEYDTIAAEDFNSTGEDFVSNEPIRISLGAGWFHSTTARSLPDAVRVAEFISTAGELRTGAIRPVLRDFRQQWNEQNQFFRRLNRILFRASEPSLRYQIFERFYALPTDIIFRFTAGLTTPRDRTKILSSRPPIPVARVMKTWKEKPVTKSPTA